MDEKEQMDPTVIKGLFEQGVSYIIIHALWSNSDQASYDFSLWV